MSEPNANKPSRLDDPADFVTFFDFLPIGAYRSSPEGVQLRANPALVQLNGYGSEAEMLAAVRDIGTEWYVDPARRAQFRQLLERDGQVTDFVSEIYRHKTRERLWVSENAHVVRDAAGGILRFEGTVEDISARLRADAERLEREQRWRLALDSLGDGVWDWNLQTGEETFSRHCLEMYGYAPGELVQRSESLDGLTHPDDLAQMAIDRRAHLEGRAGSYHNEHRVRCKDGRWKWVLSRGMVVERDALGRPLRMIGTHTDITARKEAQALQRERDLTEVARQAQSRFLSRVSHELRTPLNAILGFSQLIAITPDTGERQRGWVREVLNSGAHLLGLVDDILDLSSAQTGQLRFNIEAVDLAQALGEAWTMLSGPAQQASISLASKLPAGTWVLADPKRLKQVLSNLLSNAIKFNRPGGRVEVVVRRLGRDLDIAITDQGPGLSPADIGRLFQPFERLGAQRSGVEGTGLGLALCRQLAEGMGGSVRAASMPGRGATFHLRLPAAESGAVGSLSART